MTEPEWLSVLMTVAIHDEQLVIHGGASGIRDTGMLERRDIEPIAIDVDRDPFQPGRGDRRPQVGAARLAGFTSSV